MFENLTLSAGSISIVIITTAYLALINLKTRFFSVGSLIAFVVGVLLFVRIWTAHMSALGDAFLGFFVAYVAVLAISFSREILPSVSEKMIHFSSLFYLFTILNHFKSFGSISLVFLLLPAGIVFLYAFITKENGAASKLVLYTIYIFMLSFSEYYQFTYYFDNYRSSNVLTFYQSAILFCTVGVAFYLIVHVANLIKIIPIPTKHESFDEMINRVRTQCELFVDKVSDEQASPGVTLFTTIVFLAVFIVAVTAGYKYGEVLLQLSILLYLGFFYERRNIVSLFSKKS